MWVWGKDGRIRCRCKEMGGRGWLGREPPPLETENGVKKPKLRGVRSRRKVGRRDSHRSVPKMPIPVKEFWGYWDFWGAKSANKGEVLGEKRDWGEEGAIPIAWKR